MADVKESADQIGKDYVLFRRPNPASMVSCGFDPKNIRKLIRQALVDSKGYHIEVMLKELMTVEVDLFRLSKWTEIARQESENS